MDEEHDGTQWNAWIMAGAALLAAGLAAGMAVACYRKRPQQRARRLVDRSRRLIDTITEALDEFEQATSETEG
jgi:hypothetical protein